MHCFYTGFLPYSMANFSSDDRPNIIAFYPIQEIGKFITPPPKLRVIFFSEPIFRENFYKRTHF
jgi:hypothetical protein